jgi:hypothetical protein
LDSHLALRRRAFVCFLCTSFAPSANVFHTYSVAFGCLTILAVETAAGCMVCLQPSQCFTDFCLFSLGLGKGPLQTRNFLLRF